MDNIIYSRIKELCKKNGISVAKLESDLEFGNASIQKWKNSTSPSVDKVIKIASYFDVSVDYLLGRSELSSSVSEILNNEDIISFQRAREKMSVKDRNKMMQMLRLGFEYAFKESNTDNNGGDAR